MSINRELNEQELERVIGTPVKTEELPKKFKQFRVDEEMSEKDLESVYGGPIKEEDLPDWAYTNKRRMEEEKRK